jgi:hypothetical protein
MFEMRLRLVCACPKPLPFSIPVAPDPSGLALTGPVLDAGSVLQGILDLFTRLLDVGDGLVGFALALELVVPGGMPIVSCTFPLTSWFLFDALSAVLMTQSSFGGE